MRQAMVEQLFRELMGETRLFLMCGRQPDSFDAPKISEFLRKHGQNVRKPDGTEVFKVPSRSDRARIKKRIEQYGKSHQNGHRE